MSRPRGPLRWLDPGAFGTLGVGAGFALGAKLCRPDADVWIVYGDGSLGYSSAEFDTFTRHKVCVCVCDTSLYTVHNCYRPEIYLLIAIFAIGEQKSVLAKQHCMHFFTGDENAKGQGCNSCHSASKAAVEQVGNV